MKIDIYRSATNSRKYLAVPAGTNVEKKGFPSDLDQDLRKLCPFKTLDVDANDKRIAVNGADIAAQIKEKGYATLGAAVSVKVQAS